MRTVTSILDLVGATPMLRLTGLEPEGGAQIWAKLEYLSPGGSVKDRIGLGLIRAAERDGRLRPGGTVVEATAGNTGIALAMAGVRLGYRVVLVVPDGYAVEKQRLMRALGAEVETTPSAEGMAAASHRAAEIALATPGAVHVDQFANPANPAAHEETTGPEILEQMNGRLDAIVVGCGSGGTFTGAVRFLKSRIPGLRAVAVEPQGSILGGGEPGHHETEGIGMSELQPVMDMDLVDEVITVPDPEAFAFVRRLASGCGVLAGSSAGANAAAAMRVAAKLESDRRVVTVIPDSCERYMSKNILELFPEAS